jgi:hypothetical protein
MSDELPTPEEVKATFLLGVNFLSARMRDDTEALQVLHNDHGCIAVTNALCLVAGNVLRWHWADADDELAEQYADALLALDQLAMQMLTD